MFTGIIQDIGRVRSIEKKGEWCVWIDTKMNLSDIDVGASIACSGCCLTLTDKDSSGFCVDVSAETLSKTIISDWQEKTPVNLESSLRLGDTLDGHFVFGHVDGQAVLEEIREEGGSHRLTVRPPQDLMPFIAPKGSVSLDGVSLTVNEVREERFGVNIIPHTWAHTTLGQKKAGEKLNIEIDMLARYVARQLRKEQEESRDAA